MATYCFSDLHAQYDLWEQIKEYLKPEDKAFCLGDCVDRGPAGLEILYEVINHPNITLLRGNHEDFILHIGKYHQKKLEEIARQEDNYDPEYYDLMHLWYANGAKNTINSFNNLSKIERNKLLNTINDLPTRLIYINKNGDSIYLCHAGCQPQTEEIPDLCEGMVPMNNYIWDRYHIMIEKWRGKKNEFCVHGHTPIMYLKYFMENDELPKDFNKIYTYCENHKIDIDLGSFETHTACLFNLDTFEPIYFKDKGIK